MRDTVLLWGAVWLFFISLLTVAMTVSDKRRAKKHRRRISERTLMLLALFGGSAAEWITMRLIRHKTLHAKFMIGLPLIFLLQTAVVLLLYLNTNLK